MALIPALGRQRQTDEFEAGLVYKVSCRAARATQRNPVSKTKTERKRKEKSKEKETKPCEVHTCTGYITFPTLQMRELRPGEVKRLAHKL